MSVTDDTSQAPRSPLNEDAPENIPDRSATEDTSQVLRSPLNALAK